MEKPKYEDSFKKKVVELYKGGKPAKEIIKEYHISSASFWKWVQYERTSGSFRKQDNRSQKEKDYRLLEKEVKQLRMENDILKQAALIMGRKDG